MMVNVTPGSIPRSLQHVLRLWVCDWLHQHGIQFHRLPGLQGPLVSVRHAGRGKPCHQWCSCHKQQHKKDQKPLTERLVFCEGGGDVTILCAECFVISVLHMNLLWFMWKLIDHIVRYFLHVVQGCCMLRCMDAYLD